MSVGSEWLLLEAWELLESRVSGGATGKRGLIPGGDFVSETAIALQIVVILSYLRMLFEVEKNSFRKFWRKQWSSKVRNMMFEFHGHLESS